MFFIIIINYKIKLKKTTTDISIVDNVYIFCLNKLF